jgi:transcriptional regulator with XRE-family HTH domain
MGWSQEKVAEIVGITQQRVDQLEKDASNTNICNACIPDLRYKIKKKDEDRIYERYQKGESQEQIASDYGISRPRVTQLEKDTSNINIYNACIPMLVFPTSDTK